MTREEGKKETRFQLMEGEKRLFCKQKEKSCWWLVAWDSCPALQDWPRVRVCEQLLRALSYRFLSCCWNLPVTVNHLNHQPELQSDDGHIHHQLGQDGDQSPFPWRHRDPDKAWYSGYRLPRWKKPPKLCSQYLVMQRNCQAQTKPVLVTVWSLIHEEECHMPL